MSRRANSLEKAVRAHANLNTLISVISILEGGSLYGGNPRTNRASQKIIGICKQEQQRLLREYDGAREIILTPES